MKQDFIFKPQGTSASSASGKKLEEMERAHILRVVEECGGNQSHAADDTRHRPGHSLSQAEEIRLEPHSCRDALKLR